MQLLDAIRDCRAFDLSQPYFVGMPHHPSHPPFLFSLTKKHGDYRDASGMSSAADSIGMSGHTGTHVDALGHFSCGGKFFGGEPVSQSYAGGVAHHSIADVAPMLRRGVLLDIAALLGVDSLDVDFVITAEHFEEAQRRQNVTVKQGDIALFRTGWARFWSEPAQFFPEAHGPGPAIDGARWLSSRKVFAAGSDTLAFEHVPDPAMPVHVHLLVENGIHLIENLNLEELSSSGAHEFVFIAAPLKILGGTGGPVRPIALVPAS
jgi:kynurenine formamidase